ncbi:DC-STAMP domain-containing protein 2 isoform X2 [Rhinoderma darwinii]
MVMQGPAANIMENVQRSSQSMACGAQLAINQTKDLVSKITKPLMGALNILKNIGKKLRSATDHASKFFQRFFAGVKHVEKLLRSVWAFIANIGEICNDELERPYIKCNKLFDEAKNNCFKVMSFMGFLCYILDAFRPLCGLARILVVFCAIPYYVESLVRKHVKNPILSTIRNFKDQLYFNITVIHDFDVNLNVSRNYFDMTKAIMKEVKENMDIYMEMLSMFSYSMVIVCVFTYIQALRYRRKYLTDDNHDNIYITRRFIELDVMRAKQNRNTLLPLSSREAYGFIRPGSLALTKREKKGYTFEILNVFRSFLMAMLIVVVDFVFFWILDFVGQLLRGEVITRAPLIFSLLVNGTGATNEIYKTIVSAFDAIQRSNITIQISKCQVLPSKPDYHGYVLLGFMHGFAFFIAVFGIYMQRLKRYICAYYYPTREQVRICFLYNKLLTKRIYLERALFRSIMMNDADMGHIQIILILAAKCPWLFGWLAKYMGATEKYCFACAQICTGKKSEEYRNCCTNGCRGIYCRECSKILNNICTICMAPLVCDDIEDEEIDSSDDEKVVLWMEAMKSIKEDEKPKRKKMKKVIKGRIKETIKRRGKNDPLIQKYKESMMSGDSEESSGLSDVDTGDESGESDFEYQTSKVNNEASSKKDYKPATTTSLQEADLIPPAGVP